MYLQIDRRPPPIEELAQHLEARVSTVNGVRARI